LVLVMCAMAQLVNHGIFSKPFILQAQLSQEQAAMAAICGSSSSSSSSKWTTAE
jgi:hypothetical protein